MVENSELMAAVLEESIRTGGPVVGVRLSDGSVRIQSSNPSVPPTTIPPPPGPAAEGHRPSAWARAKCWFRHRRHYFWGFRERDRAWIEFCPRCPRLVSAVHRDDIWF